MHKKKRRRMKITQDIIEEEAENSKKDRMVI